MLAAALTTALAEAPTHAAPARFELISRAANGGPTNGSPGLPDISADGRWVVYSSGASNIVRSDTNNAFDVFLLDRRTGRVRNLTIGGNGNSDAPRISADGRRVVFTSLADNLVQSSADPSTSTHVFVWTRGTGAVRQVDVAAGGGAPSAASASPDISADGQVVVFTSRAGDLVGAPVTPFQHVYRRDLGSGTTTALEGSSTSDATFPSVDADGDRVAYTAADDVLLWRKGRPALNLTPAVGQDGTTPSVSAAGDRVAFANFDGIHVVDVRTLTPRLVGPGPADSPAISDDGNHVTFNADSDLVPGDDNQVTDAYRWSASANRVVRISGSRPPGSGFPRPSRDGSLVVFLSDDLLVPGDTNQFRDGFVRRPG